MAALREDSAVVKMTGTWQKAAGAALAVAALLALAAGTSGCSRANVTAGGSGGSPTQQLSAATTSTRPATTSASAIQTTPPAAKPKYTKWIVNIKDDDSSSQGAMTYKIALNLKATSASTGAAGKYTGTATAKTSVSGSLYGRQLNATAMAKSSKLQFTLTATEGNVDANDVDTGGGALAPLTSPETTYRGTGTITMKASGTAHLGAAAGGFSNTSSQPIKLSGAGTKITMTVPIQGHTYSFQGTIRGEK